MPRRNQGPRLRFLEKRGVYYVVWTEMGRSRERSTGTSDREQAEAFFAEWFQLRVRREGPSDPTKVLVTDVLSEYAEERGPKTQAPSRIGYAVHALVGYWEHRSVAEIRPQSCDAYCRYRGRSTGTVRRELGVLRAAVNYAHQTGRLTRAVAVELPDRPDGRERWLTRSEAACLLNESLCSEKVRLYLPLFILIGLYTGRRKDAILSLRWNQVDLDAGRIDFEQPGRKKNKKRRGLIPIPPRLMPHLRRASFRGGDLGYVINRNGKRLGDIRKGFDAACDRAGLSDVTPHTLRHTCATWLAQSGVPIWEAAGYLGVTVQTFERTYGHHHPDFMSQAAQAASGRPWNVRIIK